MELLTAFISSEGSSQGCQHPALPKAPGWVHGTQLSWPPAAMATGAGWVSRELPSDASTTGGVRLQHGRCHWGCSEKELRHPWNFTGWFLVALLLQNGPAWTGRL